MKILSSIAAASLVAFLAAPAQAEEAYTAKGLADFFVQSADLGASRGICIGTVAECQPTKAEEPASKDMLINFELASHELTPEARRNLDVFVNALKDERLAAAQFVIEGHTDASGSDTYNAGLSERRAESVRRYIAERGIGTDRLVARGLGEAAPRSDDPFDPVNRRVEMRLSLN